jgi:vitamin B12 transporter
MARSRPRFLRASAGRGFTEPSLLQNFAREPFYVGNPQLKPERTTMADLGLVQEMFGRRVRAEVTYFRNTFRDLIVFDGSTFPSTWSNIDRSRARGMETSVTVRPARYVQVTGNYTRLHTRILQTNSFSPYSGVGQELPRGPATPVRRGFPCTPRRWNLMIGGRAMGERQDADWIYGVTRNPGFGTVFVNASYNLTRHVTPYVRIDNLLNERYQEVLGFTALTRSAIGGVRVAW